MAVTFYVLGSKPAVTCKRRADLQTHVGRLDNDPWDTIRAANKLGITPYVFVDPYAAEIYGKDRLYVYDNEDDAKHARRKSAEEI